MLQNIVEEVKSQTQVSNETVGKRGSVREILAKEATKQLESKRNLQDVRKNSGTIFLLALQFRSIN